MGSKKERRRAVDPLFRPGPVVDVAQVGSLTVRDSQAALPEVGGMSVSGGCTRSDGEADCVAIGGAEGGMPTVDQEGLSRGGPPYFKCGDALAR